MLSDTLREHIKTTLADWDVPGCSVGIVQQGQDGWDETVEAFGMRDEGLAMTTKTRVIMASNTKLFTALSIDILLRRSDGYSYTTRVKDIIPAFQLWDPVASDLCTVEDLLCHRTGLGRYNELLRYDQMDDIIRAIKHFRPAGDFRAGYIYNNWMYDLLALIIEQLSGQTFAAFTTDNILRPLGMLDSTLSFTEAEASCDIAAGYWRTGETTSNTGHNMRVTSEMAAGVALNGSAGLWSTVEDMTKWLRFLISKGESCPGVAHADFFDLSIEGRTIVDVHAEFADLSPRLYGLARRIGSYQGVQLVEHGGHVGGVMSQVCIVPAMGWGIVLQVNSAPWGDLAYNIIKWRAFDEAFGLQRVDWDQRYWARRAREVKQQVAACVIETAHDVQPAVVDDIYIAGTYAAGPCQVVVDVVSRDAFPPLTAVPIFTKTIGPIRFLVTHHSGAEYDGALCVQLPGAEMQYGKRLKVTAIVYCGEVVGIRVRGLMGLDSTYTGRTEGDDDDVVFERV